jgi:hypothetical protein
MMNTFLFIRGHIIVKMRIFSLLTAGLCFWFAAGCGGGSGGSSPAPTPTPTTDLSGTLVVPATVNSALLTRIVAAQNTDSEVRNAFAVASVWVNDAAVSDRVISPSAVDSNWDFRMLGVPQSVTGTYKIQVLAGKLGLKCWIDAANKDSFVMNSQTTAAALLAEQTGLTAEGLIATFPVQVGRVAKQIETAFNASTTVVTSSVFAHPDVVQEVASQAAILKDISAYDSSVKVAYLGLSNDLDGNGTDDLLISQTVDRTGIRFSTPLSQQTSLQASGSTLSDYPDVQVLQDFSLGNLRTDRTFDGSAANVLLGLYFSKSAGNDKYLKLLIKRVDLKEGTFSGVLAEYGFVTATGTAIATGTKQIAVSSATISSSVIQATDLLSDSATPTANLLAFIDLTKGLGNPDGTTRMIRAVDGQPELANLSSAERYNEYGAGYYVHAQAALAAINKNRGMAVGDVFAVFFPTTRHYALIKIKSVDVAAVAFDFIVNSAPDEPKF